MPASPSSSSSLPPTIPTIQRAAIIHKQGTPIQIVTDYPVPTPSINEVLVKVLYTGVCQSDLHTAQGTAPGPDGKFITNIKFPHVGGHEGVGRIVQIGPTDITSPSSDVSPSSGDPNNAVPIPDVHLGQLVGIRFLARVCHTCEFCLSGREQHCGSATNHLHHEDGSFQEYCVLDRGYLTGLPEGVDERSVGPVLCAGVTTYKAVKNANVQKGQWVVVVGAGGGLGHLAIQYARAAGVNVIGIDSGLEKRTFIESLGGIFIDFRECSDVTTEVHKLTSGGAHAAIVASGSGKAFSGAVDMLRIGGTLSCVGIPPGDVYLTTPIATIIIKGLKVVGNLVGSMEETLEAIEIVRRGDVKVLVKVMDFEELPAVYEMLERGDVLGRIVLRVARDE